MKSNIKDYLETLGTDVIKHMPETKDIKSNDALRRTHAMTVALLEHAHELIRQAEKELSEQAKRIESLESLALTDELTGLLNRRGFEDAVKREVDLIKRNRAGQGVFVIIDLDKFKPINDTYGHLTGDLALKTVAANLKNMIRHTDIAGRIGGDEFAFYLANIGEDEALMKLKEINKGLNNIMLPVNGEKVEVHASLGCVAVNKDTPSYEDVYEKADTEMYRIKMLTDTTDFQRSKILEATNIF